LQPNDVPRDSSERFDAQIMATRRTVGTVLRMPALLRRDVAARVVGGDGRLLRLYARGVPPVSAIGWRRWTC
jgi:hypothetical protein